MVRYRTAIKQVSFLMPTFRNKLRHRLEHLGNIVRFPEDGRRILFFPKRPDMFRGPLDTGGRGLVLEGLSSQYVKLTILNNIAPSLRMGGATSNICGHTDRPTDMQKTVRHFPQLGESALNSKCASRLINSTKMCQKFKCQ